MRKYLVRFSSEMIFFAFFKATLPRADQIPIIGRIRERPSRGCDNLPRAGEALRVPVNILLAPIQWAVDDGAHIISMSLGIAFSKIVTRMVSEKLPQDIAISKTLVSPRANVRLFDELAGLVTAIGAMGRHALLIGAGGNASNRKQGPNYEIGAEMRAAAEGVISVGALALVEKRLRVCLRPRRPAGSAAPSDSHMATAKVELFCGIALGADSACRFASVAASEIGTRHHPSG